MSLTNEQLNNMDYTELSNLINNIIDDILVNEFNIDISNYKDRYSIKHSTISYCLSMVHKRLFIISDYKYNPNKANTIIDLNNNDLLLMLGNIFIDICKRFNKSFGLVIFGDMIGVDATTISCWMNPEGEKLNPGRVQVLHNVQEGHKAQHISLMNDSGLGLLAVANNDTETGLNWQEKQQKAAQQNTVFLLPSERIERMRIENKDISAVDVKEV